MQPRIAKTPHPRLALSIVIPCLDEPNLSLLLKQLHDQTLGQTMPDTAVEILVIVNHSEHASAAIRAANAKTIEQLRQWQTQHSSSTFQLYPIDAFDLPVKTAGVGLARKIAMDEAMHRFAIVDRPDGIIASLDADCLVSKNYISGLIASFEAHHDMHAATLAYAHRLEEIDDPRHLQAMICYELFLRYVELGWRHAGLPYAFTSIGSCFAVRANACARHHGMNRRKAGEDFYFLHKLAREKPLGHIPNVCVYPSARISSRTPFGTGQTIGVFYHGTEKLWPVADPRVFDELKCMREALSQLYHMPTGPWLKTLPEALAIFLDQAGIVQAAENMRRHAASPQTFAARFFTWFDGLTAWRYVNRDDGQIAIEQALAQLLGGMGLPNRSSDLRSLLMLMRRMDTERFEHD